jgi:hypothetical protein
MPPAYRLQPHDFTRVARSAAFVACFNADSVHEAPSLEQVERIPSDWHPSLLSPWPHLSRTPCSAGLLLVHALTHCHLVALFARLGLRLTSEEKKRLQGFLEAKVPPLCNAGSLV